MRRVPIKARPDLAAALERRGMLYHENYYTEQHAYQFTMPQIERLERATNELFDMCLKAVGHVIGNNLFDRYFIPEAQAAFIRRSWEEDDVSLYGRFDFAYDPGTDTVKMLEFNADTPTSLLEAAVIQWDWLEAMMPAGTDQWNSIHERLVAHLQICKPFLGGMLHVSCANDSAEDRMTVEYVAECARQAGYDTAFLYIPEISLNERDRFCRPDGYPIGSIFKLYPWEWLLHKPVAAHFLPNYNYTTWVEPPYKAILSSKMLLATLWELFPGHPLLLESFYTAPGETQPELQGRWVRKPVFSREGANVRISDNGRLVEETGGEYGAEGWIMQRYVEIQAQDGYTPVIGAWVIGGEAAGMGIREQQGSRITGNMAQFAPHFIA